MTSRTQPSVSAGGFETLSRSEWSALGQRTGSPLSVEETGRLAATGEPVTPEEVVEVYLPLAELLTVLAAAKRDTNQRVGAFLGSAPPHAPFIIGIAGGVAVGKSTTARVLQALLRQQHGDDEVELLTTDGFLYPNAILEARGIMGRKGFPESYDRLSLLQALAAIRAGDAEVVTPVYSHMAYDVVAGESHVLRRPSIVIVEGLNVLQVSTKEPAPEQVVSDFFDFSIYVDAAESDVATWFRDRLLALRATVLREPEAYFHRFAGFPEAEVVEFAEQIWRDINLVNLRENIAPTRGRANLILEKDSAHRMHRMLLRRP